ncbi:MAG: signal peptidase I [Bacteroidales bacterium]|jgi:signal peptidase I|nr:signal peptidase I [Bacteroidales bacterium]
MTDSNLLFPFLYIATILFLIFLIRKILFIAEVKGNSMWPSLKNGDRVLVSRIFFPDLIKSGSIVILAPWFTCIDQYIIKRIIAKPNDEVYIVGIKLKELQDILPNDIFSYYCLTIPPDLEIKVAFSNNNLSPFLELIINHNYGITKLPERRFFVTGDWMPEVGDSRSHGPCPTKSIKGLVLKIL